jgi:hypothetical protein
VQQGRTCYNEEEEERFVTMKKKKIVTGRTRSYAAMNPWKEGL